MSKIALTPNASGTGTFTLAAPNSNTSRTITLPDEAGEVLVNGTNQNVGIGTSSPSFEGGTGTGLEINNSSGNGAHVKLTDAASGAGGTNGFDLYAFNTSGYIENYEAGSIVFRNNGSERMRIDSSGNVGIGTSSPTLTAGATGVDIYDNSDAQIRLHNSTTGTTASDGLLISLASDNSGYFYSYENAPLIFGTNSTERMRIDASGSFQLSPASNQGTFRFGNQQGDGSGIGAQFYLDATQSIWYNSTTSTADKYHAQFINGNGLVGHIKTNGSSTAYNTSSDYRLKTDAQPMTGASARVQALNPVNFEWIADGTRVDGFLAHEAQEVVPEAVSGTKDAMRDEEYEVTPAVYEDVVIPAVLDEDGNELEAERTEQQLVTEAVMGTRSVPDYQGIDQSKLVPLLTAALQEALTEISDLKARVTALEAV